VYMVGVLIGSICVGLFADRFGRLTTLVIGAAATAISGIAGV
jgi:MFS family permease